MSSAMYKRMRANPKFQELVRVAAGLPGLWRPLF
jgi:uncharacterized membrane protein (DUF485 family)